MTPSPENKTGARVHVATWLGSSAFGIVGTVLLVCWLLADALEPKGRFSQVGLVLALTAYAIDWWGEGRRSGGDGPAPGLRGS